jgi:hypothetical protein
MVESDIAQLIMSPESDKQIEITRLYEKCMAIVPILGRERSESLT